MNFDQEKTILSLYIDNAKSFVQLSSAFLGLSITFKQNVMGQHPRPYQHILLIAAWIAMLAAALSGAFYQYLAVKYLDSLTDEPGTKGPVPQCLIDNPGYVYTVMFVLFYLGFILLAASVL